MTKRSLLLVATALVFSACAPGAGCSGFKPLPMEPAPLGLPRSQVIEGGIQARITKPGVDKLVSTITGLFGQMLAGGFCASDNQTLLNVFLQTVEVCQQTGPGCPGNTGCSAYIYLDSKDRPATHQTGGVMPPPAANNQDGKLGITVTVLDSPPQPHPQIKIDATIDVLVPARLSASGVVAGSCYLYAYSRHVDNNSQDPLHVIATIGLTVNPTTGKLQLNLDNLDVPTLGITTDGVGGVCDFISVLTSAVLDFLDSIPDIIRDFIIDLLTPAIDDILQSFLPDPLGLVGVLDTGSMLASFNAPKEAGLEEFIVPGGYVGSKSGGLTLGVMSGSNSDRDPTTRTPALVSEPALCVPQREVPNLAMPPWNLPPNPTRQDFTLGAANEFSGNPDPMNALGMLQDVAIGISRTYLDLIGFHLVSSGSLCLTVGGSTIPQLNAGTLAVLIPSLGNILEDRKAPLFLSLRPTQPVLFTIGEGTMQDALVHVALTDLRIDFYAWIEERYARIMTVAVDLNIGANLTPTQTVDGKAALQPMLSGIDASNINIRVSNTDLLQEKPDQLAAAFPMLISLATSALMGNIAPIALPEVAGFRLDDVTVRRVQTAQDDFIGIFSTILEGAPAPLIDWSDPTHPKTLGELDTKATIAALEVPTEDRLRALELPVLRLNLSADGAAGRPVEWSYRVDGGLWHVWSSEAQPTIIDPAFALQGRHTLDVRARAAGDYHSEDSTPERLNLLIDSMPPELHPAIDGEREVLDFGGFDVVSPTELLEYAWVGADGAMTNWTRAASITLPALRELTRGGLATLPVYARDEAGNVGKIVVDPNDLLGFHGRTTTPPSSSGCGCELGRAARGEDDASTTVAWALAICALVLLRRRSARALPLLAIGLIVFAAGCGCEDKVQCTVDDECARQSCEAGQIPLCLANMCACTPDISVGDVGRFASMTLLNNDAYIAAYNSSWGDLMVGHVTPPGIVSNWQFVDGVPELAPDVIGSHVRGGISVKGDDVGRYTSIQVAKNNEPVIAYYDRSSASLKFASFGAVRWRSHFIDRAIGAPDAGGDDFGRWASMSIGPDGRPAIAYTAIAAVGKSGKREGQLRWAEAMTAEPRQQSDWKITVLDSRAIDDAGDPPTDGGTPPDMATTPPDGGTDEPLLPEGVALMPSVARKTDGTPAIAYYDRRRGNLRYLEYDTASSRWLAPVVLDGETLGGTDTGDVGQYPSLTFDGEGTAHVSYVDATRDNLLYINTKDVTREIIDDGYRAMDELTLDNLPAPVFHLVGDSSSIQTSSSIVVVAYQDSTVMQLRVAKRVPDGTWTHESVAGHATPFMGSYGFYANLKIAGRFGIMSSYAIHQQQDVPEFFVEVFAVDLMLVQ